jgi:hypothetical protein
MTPNDDTRDEELLARYRQASADAPGPSDAVRAAILAESRRVADELAKQAPRQPIDVSRPAANDSRWKITAFGTAGAALLAALIFAPRYWETAPPAQVSIAPPPVATSMAAQDRATAEAPKSEALKPDAAPSYAAPPPARHTPSEPNSLQEIVVTQADRKRAKSSAVPSPQLAASASAPAAAPTAPPSVAQNYAPGSPSASPSASNFAAAPRAPAARANPLDLSAYSVVGGVPPSQRAESAGAADSVRAGRALAPATLHSAAAQGDVTQAATMLDQGAVIDARDEAGRTPLMLAVTQGRLETVRLLLARGADPNAADNSGHTPLQQATKRNLQDIAALLEQAGAR